MRLPFFIIFIFLFLTSCDEFSSQKNDDESAMFSDSGKSSIQINKADSVGGFVYKTVETNYKVMYLQLKKNISEHYLAKYITVKVTSTKSEQENETIEVILKPLLNPKGKMIHIKQICDDLMLEARNYYAVKHGCCGAPDVIRIYDYDNNLIVEGEEKVITANIPNSRIEMFSGFISGNTDKNFLGMLNISFGSDNRYFISLKTPFKISGDCIPPVPRIVIKSNSAKDAFIGENNQYDLWSLENVRTVDQINNISLNVIFECDPKLEHIVVPIVNGMPYGNSKRIQEVVLKKKM